MITVHTLYDSAVFLTDEEYQVTRKHPHIIMDHNSASIGFVRLLNSQYDLKLMPQLQILQVTACKFLVTLFEIGGNQIGSGDGYPFFD